MSVHSLPVRLKRHGTHEASARPARCYQTTVRSRRWDSKRLIQSRVRQDRQIEELLLRNAPMFFPPEHVVLSNGQASSRLSLVELQKQSPRFDRSHEPHGVPPATKKTSRSFPVCLVRRSKRSDKKSSRRN